MWKQTFYAILKCTHQHFFQFIGSYSSICSIEAMLSTLCSFKYLFIQLVSVIRPTYFIDTVFLSDTRYLYVLKTRFIELLLTVFFLSTVVADHSWKLIAVVLQMFLNYFNDTKVNTYFIKIATLFLKTYFYYSTYYTILMFNIIRTLWVSKTMHAPHANPTSARPTAPTPNLAPPASPTPLTRFGLWLHVSFSARTIYCGLCSEQLIANRSSSLYTICLEYQQ